MVDSTAVKTTVGIDLSDKKFDYCVVGVDGEVKGRGSAPLTERGLARVLSPLVEGRVIMETGTHSPWVSRWCQDQGYETFVANPRTLPSIYGSRRKNDQSDAEQLARLGRLDPKLLSPIRHRSERAQLDLAQIRAREGLVNSRTGLINQVRGMVKSFGYRLPSCSAETFHVKAREAISFDLLPALGALLDTIELLTEKIRAFGRAIEKQCKQNYPETERLTQVKGVGSITALTYVLVLERPELFRNSRVVGAFLGLTPRQDDSGETQRQLRITKCGDRLLRRLLVGSAHYILGPFGEECDLKTWGEKLMERGGKNAKKRAVVAVARRLAVLLHSLWRTGQEYEPLRHSRQNAA